jgi:hypothetical protein
MMGRFISILAAACLYLVPPATAQEPQGMITTADSARAAASAAYNAVFPNLFVRNPIDDAFVAFESLAPEDFRFAEKRDDTWLVRHEPLSGPAVTMTVHAGSGLVQIDSIGFSAE